MCAALLSPNCRDAFLRLSQLPSLRDWRFYSAILLAETQECVSTTFRRTHVIFNMSSTRTRRDAACHVSCQSGVAFPSFPAAKLRQKAESRCIHKRAKPTIFTEIAAPAIRKGRETRVFSFPAKFWDKNRAAIPSQRSFGTRIARFPTFFRRRASAIQRFFVYSRMTRAENERYRQV